ncbi:hypothetical protein HK099_004062 [Clydaea vesicula]|uniref:U3 small nucleolar RNA-associated protein 14 n=1 Tax=Clydaea vesicula TaxID=447962 RepID=A0AAD5U0Q1_9FUNG|nr:hypothetical protein HK099_004062 [Clydaea vesicula]
MPKNKRQKTRKEKKKINYDVFSDEEKVEKENPHLDSVTNYEYNVDKIKFEDDEEISEDEAFDDDDNEKYGEFFSQELDLNETDLEDEGEKGEDDEEDFDHDEDMMDISDLLNAEVKESKNSVKRQSHNLVDNEALQKTMSILLPDTHDEEETGELTNSEDENESIDSEASENEDDGLVTLISNLDTIKSGKKRKRTADEVTEAYEESEYNLTTSQNDSNLNGTKKKVNVSDLVGVLKDTTSFGGLKKHIEKLNKVSNNKENLGDTLAAPLAKRFHDKLNREAAYEQSKKEVGKWGHIVQKNRQAEHLNFPMNEAPKINLTSGSLISKFEANTEMENEIQAVLNDADLTEKKQKNLEELEMNKYTKEEVSIADRRAELAKMRSLMFFQEQKKKKIAKIKSKTYRKIQRKAKGHLSADLDLETLKSLDPEAAKEKLLQMERDRAKERMTLKHKNSGKWAKKMLSRKDTDSETRKALMEQLEKHEELKKKISGMHSSDDDFSGDEDDDDEEGDGGEDIANAVMELNSMKNSISDTQIPTTGVFAMKFMRKHVKEQLDASKRSIDELQEMLESERQHSSDFSENEEESKLDSNTKVSGRKGLNSTRTFDDNDKDLEQKFENTLTSSGPISIKKPVDPLKPLFEVESFEDSNLFEGSVNSNTINSSLKVSEVGDVDAHSSFKSDSLKDLKEEVPKGKIEDDFSGNESNAENPWLSSFSKPLLKSIKTNSQSFKEGKQEKALKKFAGDKKEKLRNSKIKNNDDTYEKLDITSIAEMEKAEVDEVTEEVTDSATIAAAEVNTVLTGKNETSDDFSVTKDMRKVIVESDDGADSDFEVDGERNHFNMMNKKDVSQLSQREVMRLAFADDNMFEVEFEKEKVSIMEKEKPQEIDVTLPGWGSWSGIGVKQKKKPSKKHIKKVDGIDIDKRKDSKLKNVIINEKRQKKSLKYQIPSVPHGFNNREQYEKTIRLPLGKEWQTSDTFQKLNKPKISTIDGKIIHPLSSKLKRK